MNPNVQTFKRVFWAFKPCIDGLEHCRPILSIDGTHLYGKFKGTILTAMSIDANNQIFPVAFAIVEASKNTELVGLKFNVDLISALVERWRPETHSFHLTVGEATLTLQDVQVLLGLKIKGDIVSGTTAYNWRFGLPEDANENVLHQYVRAYFLILMTTIMFPDKSGNDIQVVYLPLLRDLTNLDNYSWGSVVLATLYRNLCRASNVKSRDIGGPLILLQLWAWERISIGRPTLMGPVNATHHGPNPLGSQHQIRIDSLGRRWLSVNRKRPEGITTLIGYRDAFDTMLHHQFIWQPYTQQILSFLPGFCYDDSTIGQ
ncbi:serine/threonine-protein phosphatase 7 long form homolog [Silene latifolia]|uniref:serine/threonine-protein phosphatase 7 long form homolog n=1 Tax=Silene latifolia TaxID=37657 RepID=UPI003D774EBE